MCVCSDDREHPDQYRKNEFDDYFETENQRELRQIFNGQSQMFDALREVLRKLDEIVGKQERTLSLVSQVGQGTLSIVYLRFKQRECYVLINKRTIRYASYGWPARSTATCVN